jgi:glycosyltransferase involved in cell wall biosynthesis
MKVLLIHNKYGIISGEELMIKRTVALLRQRGHRVDCLLEDTVPSNAGLLAKERAFVSGIYSLKGVRKVNHWVRTFRPDIVQVQNLYPSLSPWVLPAIRQEGIPVVMCCANSRLVCPNGLLLSHGQVCERCIGGREYWCILRNCEDSLSKSVGYALRNFAARKRRLYHDNVTLYYALTVFQKRKLVEGGFPAERLEVIPNMVETSKSLGKVPLGNYVAFAGRGSPEKGVTTLLQAARDCPQIPFQLAGDFWRMPGVEKGKPANVELLGHLQGPRLDDFFKNCRFLVFPSICYESFGLVVIEAMLHGKPVVCSRLGGLPEIVDDGVNGLLFEPGDAVDLAARIKWLWSRPDLCVEMGKAGREKVLREYSPPRYYERLMQVYRRALELHGTHSART